MNYNRNLFIRLVISAASTSSRFLNTFFNRFYPSVLTYLSDVKLCFFPQKCRNCRKMDPDNRWFNRLPLSLSLTLCDLFPTEWPVDSRDLKIGTKFFEEKCSPRKWHLFSVCLSLSFSLIICIFLQTYSISLYVPLTLNKHICFFLAIPFRTLAM